MNWYLEALKKYAVFSGRSQRKEYWYYSLFYAVLYIGLGIFDVMIGTFSASTGAGFFSGIYGLVHFIPNISVSVRRLHDTNRSGWWLLIALVPLVGIIVLIFFLASDSTAGENNFGSNPKSYD